MGGLRYLRQIINIDFITPCEAKIKIHNTYKNDGDPYSNILMIERPKIKNKHIYLANLEVRDQEGNILNIMPQTDCDCKNGYICINSYFDKNELKTIIYNYNYRPDTERSGVIINSHIFHFDLFDQNFSSKYLHISPPNRLNLTCNDLTRIRNINGTEIISCPPKSSGISIRSKDVPLSLNSVKIEFPNTHKIWIFSMLFLPFSLVLIDVIKIINIIFSYTLTNNILKYVSTNLSTLKYGAITSLIATRVWLFYEEHLTKNINYIYVIFIIYLALSMIINI